MDKHTYSDRDYQYPTYPVFCKKQQFTKCEDAVCNNEYKGKEVERCPNCKVWRWRFVEGNDLVVGDWFETAEEADEANQLHLNQDAMKHIESTRISNITSEMIYKFEHMKKKARKSEEKKKQEGRKLDQFFKKELEDFPLHTFEPIQTTVATGSTCTYPDAVASVVSSNIDMNADKKVSVAGMIVTPKNEMKRKSECMYCGNENCHNKKFGKYLYLLCSDLLKKNKKAGVKTEVEHIEMLFRQRYHVLAEWDAYHLYQCEEFEQKNDRKMEMPECMKNGYFYSIQYLMRKRY